jgi:alpha-beta hydrolase superfamily lysophospholipase
MECERRRACSPAGHAFPVRRFALALLGCASFPRLTRPPLDPPAGAQWLYSADAVRLYSATTLPGAEPLGVVVFVLGPEIGAAPLYPALQAALREAGFATSVLHPRGTGWSDGLRGDLDDYALFLADQRLGLESARARFPSTPIFLLGHSVGAAFALELAAQTRGPLAGVVLVNPAYKLLAAEGMSPSFGDYVTYAANMVFRPSALTVDMNGRPSAAAHPADRAEAEAMQSDPLVVRYFSLRYLLAQKQVMDRCAVNAAAVAAPLLLVQGAKDALIDPAGSDELLAAAKGGGGTKLTSPEGGHGSSAVETMVEPIVGWLQGRLR